MVELIKIERKKKEVPEASKVPVSSMTDDTKVDGVEDKEISNTSKSPTTKTTKKTTRKKIEE